MEMIEEEEDGRGQNWKEDEENDNILPFWKEKKSWLFNEEVGRKWIEWHFAQSKV